MAFRLRDRAGRLTAALLSALILQLTAITHLHVVHGVDRGAAVLSAEDTVVVSQNSHADDQTPACLICLLRAQSYSFVATQLAAALPIGGPQYQTLATTIVPTSSAGHGPAAPRGPPSLQPRV